MLNAKEKKFLFQCFCYDVLRYHHLMTMCSESPDDLDQSRIAQWEYAQAKLLGLCTAYQYSFDADYKKQIITIHSLGISGRVYMKFHIDDPIEDL